MSVKKDYFWHEKTWEQFTNARSKNHLPHAILLSGSRGVGKLIFAEKIIKSLLCLNTDPATQLACNHCKACKTYESGANPDFKSIQVLEDKQQIGVDQIRKLSEFLTFSRSFDAYRVVLISPIEKMNQNATNSLLKSLEEPADNTVIILVVTHLSKVIPTIISRSQLLSIASPLKSQAVDWVKSHIENPSRAEELLEISAGSPLLAITIDDEILNDRDEFAKDLLNIFNEDNSVTEIAKKWEKYDQAVLLDWQINWLQNILKEVSAPNQKIIKFTEDTKSKLKYFSDKISIDNLWQIYQQLLRKKQIIHTSVNPLINLESVLLLWLQAR